MRKPRGSARDRLADFGPGPPSREAPQEPWEGAQAARERPPGTYARAKRSKEVYNYTSIQYTGYLSTQYTGIQGTCIQYTVIQGT